MSSSPKRRKTSPTTYIDVGDQTSRRPATAPKRASYQSPTKASLARTNPSVLKEITQAKDRRESDPNRRQSLRDAVLNRHPRQDADTIMADVAKPETVAGDENQSSEGIPVVQRSAEKDLSKVFKDIQPRSQPKDVQPTLDKSPLSSSISLVTQHSKAQIRSPLLVPRLVERPSPRESRSPSTELPPTPVQLGSPASRPRGLASSSPSGRHRRSRLDNVSTTSPLKPRDPAPAAIEEHEDPEADELMHEVASGIGDEQTAEPDEIEELLEAQFESGTLQDKQKQLANLLQQLRTLKDEVDDLNALNSKISGHFPMPQFAEDDFEQHVDSILEAAPTHIADSWRQPENHPLFQKHSEAYLTLAGPHNLSLNCTVDHQQSTLEATVYVIHVNAIDPWPKETFDMTLALSYDHSTKAYEYLDSLTKSDARLPHGLKPLMQKKPRLDVLLTSISNHFDADIERAAVLHNIKHTEKQIDHRNLTARTVAQLVPFLGQTMQTADISDKGKSLMLRYEVSANWIGQISTTTDIVTHGCGKQSRRHVRDLFREVESVDGPVKAFQAVQAVMTDDSSTLVQKKSRDKSKKARRMTEFE